MSSGKVWLKPLSLTVTLKTLPLSPATEILEGYGEAGGTAGVTGRATLNPGSSAESALPQNDVITLPAGSVIRIESPGGGGWGNPASRDRAAISADIADGILTSAHARDVYGYVVEP